MGPLGEEGCVDNEDPKVMRAQAGGWYGSFYLWNSLIHSFIYFTYFIHIGVPAR